VTGPPSAAGLLDSLTEVVFRTDAVGNWTYLNPAWTELTGLPVAETIGTNFLDHVHPDERESTVALFMAVVAGGGRYCHHRTQYGTAAAGYRSVDLRATVVVDEAGVPVANVGTITDVTDETAIGERVADHAGAVEVITRAATDTDLPVGIATFTAELSLVLATGSLRRMVGLALHPGTDLLSELRRREPAPDAALTGQWGLLATAGRTGRPQHGPVSLTRPDGTAVWLEVSIVPLADDPAAAFALVAHDVTGLRRAERQQAALAELGRRSVSGEPVDTLLQAAALAVNTVLATPFVEVFAVTGERDALVPAATIGWPGRTADLASVPLPPGPGSMVAAVLAADAPLVFPDLTTPDPPDLWLRGIGAVSGLGVRIGGAARPFGVLLTQSLTECRFTPDEGDFLQSLATVLATAAQRATDEDRLRQQSLHDPLTGLGNRVLLHDHLSLALNAARRSGHRVALLLMDLDRFKDINDTLGHDIGDRALQQIAARLGRSVRDSDTVARLGGDEFAVVLPDIDEVSDALAVAGQLSALTEDQIELAGVALRVEVSIGVAMFPEDGADPVHLLKRADVAMYRAKTLSTGVATYSPAADENRPERLRYLAALQRGIAEDELRVVYQPRVNLATGAVTGAEALVRWQHPREGLVPPHRFIPLAEQTGLIRPLTWWVLDMAVGQAARWRADGHDIPIAVNVSARMLHQSDLVNRVLTTLAEHNMPATSLTLEVTESAMMANPTSGLEVITRLGAAGVRMSVDDFGTGHSSLAYLRDLPVHELKIDRSFVADVIRDPRAVAIVRAVIDMGHALSLRVVAEGIEDAETYEALRALGCDEGQGYTSVTRGSPTTSSPVGPGSAARAQPPSVGEQLHGRCRTPVPLRRPFEAEPPVEPVRGIVPGDDTQHDRGVVACVGALEAGHGQPLSQPPALLVRGDREHPDLGLVRSRDLPLRGLGVDQGHPPDQPPIGSCRDDQLAARAAPGRVAQRLQVRVVGAKIPRTAVGPDGQPAQFRVLTRFGRADNHRVARRAVGWDGFSR